MGVYVPSAEADGDSRIISNQQQITNSLICDNEGMVKCIKKYYEFDMNHITPDMMEADIILPTIHFSKHINYTLEWHHWQVERRKEN